MNKLLRRFGKHQPDIEALSALLDGQVDAARRPELEAHVEGCTACRGVIDGMRENRALLAALPEVDAPRSFRLRVADIEAPARGGVPARSRGATPSPMRWAPMLGGGAAVIFAVVLGADIVTRSTSSDGDLASSAPERNGMLAAADSAATGQDASAKTTEGDAAGGAVIRLPDTGTSVAGSGDAGAETSAGAPDVVPGSTLPPAALTQNGPPVVGESGQAESAPSGPTTRQPAIVDPTGSPPDGDVPAPGVVEVEPSTAFADSGEGERSPNDEFAPANTPAGGAIVPDTAPVATTTPVELQAFSREEGPGDGNQRGFRIVEVAAALTAIMAGAAFIVWRWRRRGDLT